MIVAGVPAYNEERMIAKVIMLTQRHVDKVIICDDGSTDMTGEIAERLGAEVLRHEKKLGKGAALKTLFLRALELNPEVVITVDSDGQHDPNQIPSLVKPIIAGKADMVIGSRFLPGSVTDIPRYRSVGLRFVNWLSRRTNKSQVEDTQSGFRAYSLKALKVVVSHESEGYGVESEQLVLAARNDLRIIEVPVRVKYKGLDKTSKKSPINQVMELIGSILLLVIEKRPLVFLGIPGLVFVLVGSLFGAWMLRLYSLEERITTNIALASIAFLLVGMFAVFTAITLYAIGRLAYKASQQRE